MREAFVGIKRGLFIIESLDCKDERYGLFEGEIIYKILRLPPLKMTCKYRYVRTRDEFKKVVKQFGNSRYRYLHISCHANKRGMYTTNGEAINIDDLAETLNPHLKKRRLFISACDLVHADFAKAIIPASDCLSVIGPNGKPWFSQAAILWSLLYHLMFFDEAKKMHPKKLLKHLETICDLIQIKMSYFVKSTPSRKGVKDRLVK